MTTRRTVLKGAVAAVLVAQPVLDASATPEEGPAYVLEFGYALTHLHQNFSGKPSFRPASAGTVRMMVYADNSWRVQAGTYVEELGWEQLPTIALDGSPETSAIALLRWLAETALYPQRFDASGILPAASV